MEYLDGETLTARLAKGPVPLDQAFRYALEIADALDKAHRAGIIHRDLKPSNVMLTKGDLARPKSRSFAPTSKIPADRPAWRAVRCRRSSKKDGAFFGIRTVSSSRPLKISVGPRAARRLKITAGRSPRGWSDR
jgi:serine/threonine protein kinase